MITATIVSVTEPSAQPHSGGILRHECIWIFDILYSSYPRMYPSHPLNVSITIRINENAHFLTVTCYMIPEVLTIIRLCLWQQISASLNTENPGTDRQAFLAYLNILRTWTISVNVLLPVNYAKKSCPAILNLTMFVWDHIHKSEPQTNHMQVLIESIPFSGNAQWMIGEHRELSA